LSLRTLTGVALVALVADTAYVWAFASPTIPYMAAVVAHVAIGVALVVLGAALIVRDRLWREFSVAFAAVAMLVAAAFAAYLLAEGNTRDHRWALLAHIAAAGASILAVAPYVARLARGQGAERTFGLSFAAAVGLLVLFPAGGWTFAARYPRPGDRIVNPRTTPVSMQGEGGGPSSPFFPSSAQTNVGGTIPADFFTESDTCGECHRDIYDQWKSSMHHFASFNNQFYRKSIEHMQTVVGTTPSKWCAGCHDHAVFFNGRFDRRISEQIDTVEARAGLGCTSCHSIVRVGSSMGNGDFTVEYPPLHRLASSRNRYVRAIDRFLTYLDPEPHRRTFMKPFVRQDSAEFCAACHKVHLDKPVNDYRWFRGFNDYDAWQASGVSGQGARSFYYPAKSQTCVDCHMPATPSADPGHMDGMIHSHRFAAANTAVPFVNHDRAQLEETRRFLTSGFISVDIFAVSPVDNKPSGTPMVRRQADALQPMSSFAVGEEADIAQPAMIRAVGEVAAPVDKAQPRVAPGSTVRVDVVVRTRKIGHFFPGGTVDAFDVWLELEARDAGGRVVFWSGRAGDDGKGPVEGSAHFYRSYQLDGAGNPINKRNAWQTRSILYVKLIPPGAADVAHYRIRIPPDARGPIALTARLNYRKFAHYYTQFAFAGQPKPGQAASLLAHGFDNREWSFGVENIPPDVSSEIRDRIPQLPTIVVAQAAASLPVSTVGEPRANPKWESIVTRADRERWNDWGIGLLLQGDLKGAEYAFTQVTKAEPEYADGWLNVARTLIQEGETDAAKAFIAEALRRDPSLGRTHYYKALVEKADGDYDAALRSLETAASSYPRDRVVLNQIARMHFLARRFDAALETLERVQDVDPEDLQMHYTAMLCYRALGKADLANREEALFLRFKADESSQAITQSRRMISPEDNNERQLIHDHESVRLSSQR
jgi:tetratricopeptide (TPR) repeat protein